MISSQVNQTPTKSALRAIQVRLANKHYIDN
jgi:hypothetical protein